LLTASGLTLWRGYQCLFEQLEFTVSPGAALLVRGPNGSGKTTLLRVICGLTRPETGEVCWQGHNLQRQRSQLGTVIAYSGHQTGLKGDLTLTQNLRFAAKLADQPNTAWQSLLDPLGLTDLADVDVRLLSAGQQRRAALLRTLISPAPLWVMDEPLANLDDAGRDFVLAAVDSHLNNGGVALLAIHESVTLQADSDTLMLGATR
jgi:heme exporter protein A